MKRMFPSWIDELSWRTKRGLLLGSLRTKPGLILASRVESGRVIDLATERAVRAQRRQTFSDCTAEFEVWRVEFPEANIRWMKQGGNEWVRRDEQPELDREYPPFFCVIRQE